jgi:hypothetical protein
MCDVPPVPCALTAKVLARGGFLPFGAGFERVEHARDQNFLQLVFAAKQPETSGPCPIEPCDAVPFAGMTLS